MPHFPSLEWLQRLKDKLNSDERYGQIARNWEGDMLVLIEPDGALTQALAYYLDLWHGKCRDVYIVDQNNKEVKPFLTLRGRYEVIIRVIKGELDPIQAMLTRKLHVEGNMIVLVRNVPTVMEFIRCCRENTDSYT